MLLFALRRIGHAAVALTGVTILVFLLIHLVPGDPVQEIAGHDAPPDVVARIRTELGLDRPLHLQYLAYVGHLVRGDLGRSLHSRRPVSREILDRLPATVELALAAITVAATLGIPLGVVSAVYRHSAFDYLAVTFALIGLSMPIFWTGIMLIWLFAAELRWLPVSGRVGPIWSGPDAWKHLVLPALTLSGTSLAMISRLTRSSMLEVIRQDFITTARAKGLPERAVIYRHALRNALLPVVTYVGLEVGFLMGGAVVTESVFAWPGLGRFVLQSIANRDYPVIQGVVLFLAVCFVMINLVVDLLYAVLDPRVQYD
jgi:peptide/nickel transport system permease protein